MKEGQDGGDVLQFKDKLQHFGLTVDKQGKLC